METISYPKEIKANKEHICDFCCDKIRVDEKYITSTHKQDVTVYTWKTHTYCSNIASRLKMYDDRDEGVTTDDFQETIHSKYFDLILSQFSQEDIIKYRNVIQEFRKVYFKNKLLYVIAHYNKLDSETITIK